MSDYPRMLYRKGTSRSTEYHGLPCDTMIVDSAEDEQYHAKSEGWRRTPAEAHGKQPEAITPDTPEAAALQDERDGLLQEVETLKADKESLTKERDELKTALAAAQKERDETRELLATFDRDSDGKPGGSKSKAKAAEG